MKSQLLNTFKTILDEVLEETPITSNDVVKQIEFAHDGDYFNTMLMLDKENFLQAVQSLLSNVPIKKIAIYPCNSYIEQIVQLLEAYELVICDDYKQGEVVQGCCVVSTEILNVEAFDMVLIISYRDLVRDNLLQKLHRTDNLFWIYDVVKKYIEQDTDIFAKLLSKKADFEKVERLLEKIHAAKRPIVSLNGFLFNNYGPTYRALKAQGYEPFVVTRNQTLCYAKPQSKIHEFVIEETIQLELLEMLYLCQHLQKAVVLVNDISFLIPSFDASKAIVNFSFVTMLLKMLHVPKFLLLYDVIHSVMKNHHDTDIYFRIYQKALLAADGLICNSNTSEVHSSIRYALGIKKPMLSFYRYNEFVPKMKPKIDDGSFHLVIIGGMDDKLRDSTMMLKKILSQKIHVHNYVNNNAIHEFWCQLDEEQKRYFHRHDSIVSQYALIEEISQYHAGWIMDNGFEVLSMINSAENKAFKEMLMMFRLTTISSSLLAMGAAGLPMFLNKMVVHVTYHFPKEFFIAIEEPEVECFSEIVDNINWEERYSITQAKRTLFSIDTHIKTLTTWLDAQT